MMRQKFTDRNGPQVALPTLPPPPMGMAQPPMGQQMGQPPMQQPQMQPQGAPMGQQRPPMGQPQMGQQRPQMGQQRPPMRVGPMGMAPGTPNGPPAGIPPVPGQPQQAGRR